MEFLKQEWFKLAFLLITVIFLVFFYINFKTQNIIPIIANSSNTTTLENKTAADSQISASSSMFISDVIKDIYKIYSYGPGPRIISADEHRILFTKPHETEGCNTFTYIDLATGKETDSLLSSCPKIDTSISYPFYIEDCSFNNCYDFKTLYVVNLLTLEKKAVHTINNMNETTIKECHETDYDPVCVTDISIENGNLSINIYKSTNRKPYEIYKNSELIRTDKIDLLKLFGMERPQ